MAGLYGRMVDPNFAAPTRGGVGANAGIGAPGSAGLPRQQDDNFDAAQMAGLLGMLAKQKKPGEESASAAPGALDAAQPGMTPITNGGNFDMAQAMAPGAGALPNGGNFAMPSAGSGEAFQLGGIGTSTPMSNFGAGIPAGGPQAVAEMGSMAMPASIGGAGIPQLAGMDPAQLQNLTLPWMHGGFGGAGAM